MAMAVSALKLQVARANCGRFALSLRFSGSEYVRIRGERIGS